MNSENSGMHKKPSTGYPPPDKRPERKLSLKAAMALATKSPGHETLMPLVRKDDESLARNEDSRKNIESYLLDLQADIINREELLAQKEIKLTAREKDLNRRAEFFDERSRELESAMNKSKSPALAQESNTTSEPVKNQVPAKDPYKETREMLEERERYIEECENALVNKLTELTKREAEVEQLEEQLEYKLKMQ